MNDTSIKESVYKIVNSIIDEGSDVKIGSLDNCKTDSECSPDLCDKKRKKCFKYIKYINKSYPIDVFIRKMFESNIDEVKPFEHMLSILGMTDCISRIHVGNLLDDHNIKNTYTSIYNESASDFYYKYSGDRCKGFSIISIYIRTDETHANVILVENIKDFLIWNYYEPHGYKNDEYKIGQMGELCAKIANKKFIFNHREGSQCPVGIQELLEDYDPGYCLIFSYFWIWCVLNVIKRMNTYIPSNQWISYVEKCVSDQILTDKVKVYKRVISFAHSLYESYPIDKKSEKLNNSDYMKRYSISTDEYNERVSMSDIGKNRGKYGEQFAPYSADNNSKDEVSDISEKQLKKEPPHSKPSSDSKDEVSDSDYEEVKEKEVESDIYNNEILTDIHEHLNKDDKVILLKLVKSGMTKQIENLYNTGIDTKELISQLKHMKEKDSQNGIPDDVKEILSKKKFNITSNTALVKASEKGYLPIVKYLITKGADVHMNDDEAFIIASSSGHLSIVQYLVENGAAIHADNDRAIILASENGHLPIVQYLVDKGANIHAKNEALIGAIQNGYLPIVQYLVEKGADLRADDDSALKSASRFKNFQIIKYLVENGANIHADNDYALRIASKYSNISIVQYLVEKGANITPEFISMAKKRGNTDIIQILEKAIKK